VSGNEVREAGREPGRMTMFGACVLGLMAKRGIRRWTDLSDELAKNGYYFKAPRISNWVYGRHDADKEFGRALADTLNLGEHEKTELARAFLFGQDDEAGMNNESRDAQVVG
jgi:hypothetical protein